MQIKKGNIFLFLVIVLLFTLSVEAGIDEAISMEFKEAPLQDVLRAIAELAGVNLITDSSVQGTTSVFLKDLTFAEALDLLTQTHKLSYRWDGNTVIVAEPERIEQLYAQILTKNIKINYADPSEVKSIVGNLYPDLIIQPDQRNRLLIIRGKQESIEGALALIQELDKAVETEEPVQENVLELKQVSFADPNAIQGHLLSFYPDLKVQVDEDNRQLLILGQKEVVAAAVKLVERLDQKPDFQVEILTLEHGAANWIREQIVAIYPQIKIQVDELEQQLIITGRSEEVAEVVQLVKKLDIPRENKEQEEEELIEVLAIDYLEVAEVQQILADLYPELKLQVNESKREIIVQGAEERVSELLALVDRIDQPRKQVIIEARVEEISRTELEKAGISAEQLASIEFIKDEDEVIKGISLALPDFVEYLEKSGSATILANPRLMTLNGERAKLLIGDRIPVEVEEVEEGQVTKTIEYIEAGITLEFLPWITSDQQVILEVKPRVSSIGESIGSALPPINTREAETTIRLKDGETFAIGGLIQDDVIESISKVPILSEIPIFGELFKHREVDNIKTEIIIFITPHIVEEEATAPVKEEQEKAEEKTPASDNKQEEVTAKASTERKLRGLSKEEIAAILAQSRQERGEGQLEEPLPAYLNVFYRLGSDDDLQKIALNYGLPLEDILFVNGLEEDEFLPGMEITIPIPGSHLYRVKTGDTLEELAEKFAVPVEKLKLINPLLRDNQLSPGQILILPVALP